MPTCKWCTEPAIDSHIVSKLTLRVARKHSNANFAQLRRLMKPKKIHQDIAKEPLLCRTCDGKFSDIEGKFRNEFYEPLLSNRLTGFKYDAWLQRFVVFTSWKELVTSLHKLSDLDPAIHNEALKAMACWEDFLRDKRDNPGSYEHHLFLTWFIERPAITEVEWMIMRNIFEVTLIPAANGLLVWTTIPGCIFVSLIYSEPQTTWDGAADTLIATNGKFADQRLPEPIIKGWLKESETYCRKQLQELKEMKSEKSRA